MFWCRKLRFGLLLHSFSLLFARLAGSQLVNITVDDQLGDPITGFVPQYLPDDVTVWHAGSPTQICKCNIKPAVLDLTQIHNNTWHDATPLDSSIPTTITFQFTGSAVYVFNIVPNTLPNSTITLADIAFSIDGSSPYTFTRKPDPNSNTILYNQLVYHNTTLEYGPHTLTMTPGHRSLILFDYLLYTRRSDTTSASTIATSTSTNAVQTPSSDPNTPTSARSSSAPVGAIVGGVVGGVVLLSGVAFGAFLLGRKRTHSQPAHPRQGYGAFPEGLMDRDATSHSAVDSDTVTRWLHGAETHNLIDHTSKATGQITLTPRSSPTVTTIGALTAGRSSRRRSELTRRLEALQRTRSILSSHPPSGPSQSEFSSEGSGTATAIRDLEAEMAELRRVLATLNLRLVDRSHDEQLEPLPEYME